MNLYRIDSLPLAFSHKKNTLSGAKYWSGRGEKSGRFGRSLSAHGQLPTSCACSHLFVTPRLRLLTHKRTAPVARKTTFRGCFSFSGPLRVRFPSYSAIKKTPFRVRNIGAGEGNRTPVISLGSFYSTIELRPRNIATIRDKNSVCKHYI